ncbi:hypothetical protein BN140_0334 [Methanoculleus bourgensis MS2]|uniref:Uncharacterized protein n=1 Tax=Methanoculleus bourgensis (strain ATCC 43281 / DSM 3045 / OCM 15 / MS2) TaxID=1201294 RepID=I7LIS4_METBM|nr:hypothetical protein [Methanoculleus bourgensis]CCJ35257.1 hypothetical protein BN140_0334 [Methanoculleus bourgensis MS2]
MVQYYRPPHRHSIPSVVVQDPHRLNCPAAYPNPTATIGMLSSEGRSRGSEQVMAYNE